MNAKDIRGFFVGAIVVTSSLSVLAVTIPNSFTAGQPIKAADVNGNFSSLKASVDALEAAPKVIVPFSIVGTGLGLANATLQAKNTAGGVAAVISQDKTGTSDTALAIGNSGDGPLIKGYMNNGGENEFQVDGNGSVHLFTPAFTDNILLDNSNGNISLTGSLSSGGKLSFGSRLGQHLDLFGGVYGIGVQNNTMYYRINEDGTNAGGFAWYKGGTHNGNTANPGGGATLMTLGRDGSLSANRLTASTNGSSVSLSLSQAGAGPLIFAYGPNDNQPKFRVDNDGTAYFQGNVFAKGVQLTSDKNAKTNFSNVSALSVLEKVMALPIQAWNYKTDAAKVRHIGPMAQDFHAVFGLNGTDDKHISSIDTQGVALAAIQGLNRKLEAENAKLRSSLTDLEKRLAALERK